MTPEKLAAGRSSLAHPSQPRHSRRKAVATNHERFYRCVMLTVFRSYVQGGFDCGRLEWQGNFCLLSGTDHLPETRMRQHYGILKEHGILTARDGLPWWLPIEPRLRVAREAGMEVIWDLNHYWRHPDPIGYAARVAQAVTLVAPEQPFWCCFNELSFHPRMVPGESFAMVVEQARSMITFLRSQLPDVRVITAEPAHRPAELGSHALADLADVIGINVYPHELRRDIARSLKDAAMRYRKSVMITETGLHKGHPRRWKGINDKGQWVESVFDAVDRSGVHVVGICVYPIVNTPAWNSPLNRRWDNGLIREDLSVDSSLASAIRRRTGSLAAEIAA